MHDYFIFYFVLLQNHLISCFYVLVLEVALEKVERSKGSLIGTNIASIQKSSAPEVILGPLKFIEFSQTELCTVD